MRVLSISELDVASGGNYSATLQRLAERLVDWVAIGLSANMIQRLWDNFIGSRNSNSEAPIRLTPQEIEAVVVENDGNAGGIVNLYYEPYSVY